MDFLVFRKGNSDRIEDASLAAVITNKKKVEGEQAIAEGALQGEGSYIAIPFNPKDVLAKDVRASVEIVDPPEPEEPASEEPASEEPELEEPEGQ